MKRNSFISWDKQFFLFIYEWYLYKFFYHIPVGVCSLREKTMLTHLPIFSGQNLVIKVFSGFLGGLLLSRILKFYLYVNLINFITIQKKVEFLMFFIHIAHIRNILVSLRGWGLLAPSLLVLGEFLFMSHRVHRNQKS